MRRASGCAVGLFLLGSLLLPGCGGMTRKNEAPAAAPESMATGAPGSARQEPEPKTLAEAEALFERSRADLDRLALNAPPPPVAATAGAAAPAAEPAPAPAPQSAAPRDEARAEKKAAEAEAPRAKEVNTCETACKAFSSLSRASDAICRLDTDGGKRCERARQIQQDAGRRVASCSCTQ
jgi:hypothetical protein